MKPLHLIALLCCLAFAAVSATTVRWCVISNLEQTKCEDLANKNPVFVCIKKESPLDCIIAIKNDDADAITLSGENIYKAGLKNYDLVPIVAEDYSSATSDACFYSVAVAKKSSVFGLKDLRGKTSCHTGLGDTEGWNLPIGTLLTMGVIDWTGPDNKPLLQAVSEFFSASCVPGATGYPNMCQLCRGDCSKSSANEYYGNAGAFKCLQENAGQVAFLKSDDIPASERNNYDLLCQDNSRASVDHYKTCNFGKAPAHAVVTRKDKDLAALIWSSLINVGSFQLFSSANYGGKNLMFSDSTTKLQRIPPDTDSVLYLGPKFINTIRTLENGRTQAVSTPAIKWCAVGHSETTKCDQWNGNSYTPDTDMSPIECQSAPTVEDCFKKIMRGEADAIAVDGGQVYTAGKCGLVPAMAEQYDEAKCSSSAGLLSSYFSVAVVKKGSGVTWANLRGKRSCHTGIGRTAGWNIPMGHIHNIINDCDFTKFFSSGCAPGADISSPFCRQCIGSGKAVGDESKCKPNAEERYYGYAGAFRCLADGNGDVAFIKHTTVGENTNGNGPDWAKILRSEDFELICPGKDPMAVTEYEACNLASVPAHAVMTRPEIHSEVVRVLQDQQAKFGPNGSDDKFKLFQSEGGKNLLFKDSTKCLQEVPYRAEEAHKSFLGPQYTSSMDSLRQCSATTPDLEKSCAFQSCQ